MEKPVPEPKSQYVTILHGLPARCFIWFLGQKPACTVSETLGKSTVILTTVLHLLIQYL